MISKEGNCTKDLKKKRLQLGGIAYSYAMNDLFIGHEHIGISNILLLKLKIL